jgi:Putative porin
LKRSSLGLALLVASSFIRPAEAELFRSEKLELYGDFRVRLESDWDSQDAAGVPRDDRTRLRARMRVGMRYDPNEHWRVEARLRSGQEGNQQSSNITLVDFDGNDTGNASFDLDRWVLRGDTSGFHAWVGRDDLPFWTQDELLFDNDVTVVGLGGGWRGRAGPGDLSVVSGIFSPPVGTDQFTGRLTGAQVLYEPVLDDVQFALALGGYAFDGDADDPDAAALLEGNGGRDYLLLQASVQARFTLGSRPLTLGTDLLHNAESYSASDPDPITAANTDAKDGYVALATWGALDERGSWLVGYAYAHLETLAVNNSYSQDDWVRWGSSTQTRASNLRGHELRFGWAFDRKINVLIRAYMAHALTTVEDGKRARVDFNYRF